jgi:hypothetical protein
MGRFGDRRAAPPAASRAMPECPGLIFTSRKMPCAFRDRLLDSRHLHLQRTIRRSKSWLKPALAGACIALLLGIVFASAASSFHRSLHDGCGGNHEQEQNCAVCAFVKGQMDAVEFSPPLIARDEVAAFLSLSASTVLLPAVDFLLLPERAPPVLS